MSELGIARLKQLREFLSTLPAEKFNFSCWVTKQEAGCGTVCCAIGWCPVAFPNEWEWVLNDNSSERSIEPLIVRLTHDSTSGVTTDAAKFFELSEGAALSLFVLGSRPWTLEGMIARLDLAIKREIELIPVKST